MGNTLEDPAEGVRAQHDGVVACLAAELRRTGLTVETVQTHISTVLLAGEHAYKLKKPLRLPFLDFSTLAQREHFCREELRINRRTAPDVYVGVLPVYGTWDAPRLGAQDEDDPAQPVLDWVVHMRRFPQAAVLAELARQQALDVTHVDALARHVAAFHGGLPALPMEPAASKEVSVWASESLDDIEADSARPAWLEPPRMATVRESLLALLDRQAAWREQRRRDGWVRECHGDLHLGNVVLWQGQVMAFDAIEFDAGLRDIDVMNDAAFVYMDLLAEGLPALAWRFINTYVEQTGDYGGLVGLRAFAAYRALVRAKVALLSAADPALFERYWRLAETLLQTPMKPRLVLTMGMSGSGKSTVAQVLVEALAQQGDGAVRVRSDVERKRLHGMAASERPTKAQVRQLYDLKASLRTYERLRAVAEMLLQARLSVVLDAAFLRQGERDVMRRLAQRCGAVFAVVECIAPTTLMRDRLVARQEQGQDASDANPEVLLRQMGFAESMPGGWADVHWTVLNDGELAGLQRTVRSLVARWAQLVADRSS